MNFQNFYFKSRISKQNSFFPGPPFEVLKNMESHLSLEQKIKVIAVLDNLWAVFKISNLYIVENRDFQLYHVKIWKFDVSLQISNRTKFWSKILTTLIFFSSESWDSILFKYGKKGTDWGLWEAVFWFEVTYCMGNLRFWMDPDYCSARGETLEIQLS